MGPHAGLGLYLQLCLPGSSPVSPSLTAPLCTGASHPPRSRETALAKATNCLPVPKSSGHIPVPTWPVSFHVHLLRASFPLASSNTRLLVFCFLGAASLFLAGLPPHTYPLEADAPQGLSLVLSLADFTLGNLVDTPFLEPFSGDTRSGSRPQIRLLVSHRHPICKMVGNKLTSHPPPPPRASPQWRGTTITQ